MKTSHEQWSVCKNLEWQKVSIDNEFDQIKAAVIENMDSSTMKCKDEIIQQPLFDIKNRKNEGEDFKKN